MASNPTPAYLVAQISVKSYEEYMQRYGMPAIAILQKYDAEVLVASATATYLEGQVNGNWTVIIRFPSLSVAKEFYDSSAYKPLRALRMNELTSGATVLIVEGFDPSTLGAA